MCLNTTLSNAKMLAVISQGYKILAEYRLIEQEKLRGIYAIPSFTSGLHWFGVIFIHSGLYAESMFRFSILLPDNFPDDAALPTIIFQMDVFHPHICPMTHSLDLTPGFKEWRKDDHHIWHLLKYIQAIFADPEGSVCTAQALLSLSDVTMTLTPRQELNNMEALRLLARNRLEFLARVQESIQWSCEHMYDEPPTEDPHYIVFEPYDPELHLYVMQQINTRTWYDPSMTSSMGLKIYRSRPISRVQSTVVPPPVPVEQLAVAAEAAAEAEPQVEAADNERVARAPESLDCR